MSLLTFIRRPSFQPVDPLDDGLYEAIEQEQIEPEAIALYEPIDEAKLDNYWKTVEDDVRQDPDWIWIDE